VRRLLLALVLAAAACGSSQDPTLPPDASTSTSSTTSTTEVTTTTTTATTVVAPAPAQPATVACPAIPARAEPAADRPTYQLDLQLDLDANVLRGREVVRFTPDIATDRLVFRLWANGPRGAAAGAHLAVDAVYLGGTAPVPTEQPDATTLVVPLGSPLAAGERIDVTVPFTLTLPAPTPDRISRRGDTVRFGTFPPLLAWEPGVGWATEPPTALYAESSTAPVADWSVSIQVPDGLTVLAAGDERDGRWYAAAMREFAFVVGRFRIVEGQAGAPQPVHVTVAVADGMSDDPSAYLDTTVRSLTDFGTRFGPYPWSQLTMVVTPDLPGGIEYPGFIHMGPGTNDRTVPHEVGHQWFYGLVGDDQGRDPWLDEGLATWAEARFLGNLPSFVARSVPASGRGHAGAPMTYWDGARSSAYYRSVYVQGAQALAALGEPDRVDCALRLHVARNAHRIATVRDFVDAIAPVFPDAPSVLGRFGIASR
jgi:hypothetical protein